MLWFILAIKMKKLMWVIFVHKFSEILHTCCKHVFGALKNRRVFFWNVSNIGKCVSKTAIVVTERYMWREMRNNITDSVTGFSFSCATCGSISDGVLSRNTSSLKCKTRYTIAVQKSVRNCGRVRSQMVSTAYFNSIKPSDSICPQMAPRKFGSSGNKLGAIIVASFHDLFTRWQFHFSMQNCCKLKINFVRKLLYCKRTFWTFEIWY